MYEYLSNHFYLAFTKVVGMLYQHQYSLVNEMVPRINAILLIDCAKVV